MYPIHEGPFPAAPVSSGHSSGGSSGSGGSGSGSSGYKGASRSRERRADYNAMKRRGDWFALDALPMLLWADETLCSEDDPECPLPVIDIWP